jgi:hypothetical protein
VMVATGLDRTGAADPVIYLQQVSADRGRYLAAGLLLQVGMMMFLPAAAGLAEISRRVERAAVLRAGAFLLAVGALASGAAVVSGFAPSYVGAEPGTAPVPPEILDRLNTSPWAMVGFLGTAVGLGIGFILIGIGLWRSQAAPRWAAGLCVLVPITFALPGDFRFDALGWLPAVIVFGRLAWVLRAMPRQEPGNRAPVVVSSD